KEDYGTPDEENPEWTEDDFKRAKHLGPDMLPELHEAIKEDRSKPGPTGKFPEGKIHESDEGELGIAIGFYEGNVIINFGTPVKWFGLPPEEALNLGALIIAKAKEAIENKK